MPREHAPSKACCHGAEDPLSLPTRQAPQPAVDPAERWQSGRMYLTRNQAYVQAYRGFESHPLRHYLYR
jgi:hypothetical protein